MKVDDIFELREEMHCASNLTESQREKIDELIDMLLKANSWCSDMQKNNQTKMLGTTMYRDIFG